MPDDDIKIDARYGPENPAIDFAFKVIEEARPPKARAAKRRGASFVCAVRNPAATSQQRNMMILIFLGLRGMDHVG